MAAYSPQEDANGDAGNGKVHCRQKGWSFELNPGCVKSTGMEYIPPEKQMETTSWIDRILLDMAGQNKTKCGYWVSGSWAHVAPSTGDYCYQLLVSEK
jgi:hypothetical protein